MLDAVQELRLQVSVYFRALIKRKPARWRSSSGSAPDARSLTPRVLKGLIGF
jgi:hypothetical protein